MDDTERALEEELKNRDDAIEWADRLAYSIAPESVIGEHSSMNNPWWNAFEAAEELHAALRGERERASQLTAEYERSKEAIFEELKAERATISVWMRRASQLTDALQEMVDSVDPEEGAESWDLSTCPYYRRGLPGADPNGTCGFGCHDEPQCLTCHPSDGWPLEKARALLAAGGFFYPTRGNEMSATKYAYSEHVTAGSLGREHISPVEGELKLGGGAPAALCFTASGRVWSNGWHINRYVTAENLIQCESFVCVGCANAWRAAESVSSRAAKEDTS